MPVSFQRAVKYQAKARVAFIGPAGSGKSFTMLRLARFLAGEKGKIACVDSEHGSLSKYADQFDFDVIEPTSFTTETFMEAMKAAVAGGYAVLCYDSLSHFWIGKNGALEFVDNASRRGGRGDSFSAWKDFRPHERAMVDAMIGAPLHVLVTMRTKNDYQDQKDERTGKVRRVKIGLAPVQREGLEYEFDLVAYMDDENTFIVDKSRCPALTGKAIVKPTAADLNPFRDWLEGATPQIQSSPAAAPSAKARALMTAPQSTAEAPHPPPNAQHLGGYLKGNMLVCQVKEIVSKTAAGGHKEYRIIAFAARVDGYNAAFCWHKSMFEALSLMPGKRCQFEVDVMPKGITIQNILAIGDQEYRDGKPYSENLDAEPPEPATINRQSNPEITDEDLPEELFK